MRSKDITGQVTLLEQQSFSIGDYSEMYPGFYQNKRVAVRVFRAVNKTPMANIQQRILKELESLSRLDHPNIQGFYGFTRDEIFAPFGSLISLWRSGSYVSQVLTEESQLWSVQRRIDLWKDVISGVNYLHSCNPAVVHGDIKPSKVLVNALGEAVLCDPGLFGISLAEGSYETMTRKHISYVRNLAPELVEKGPSGYPTTATDVYALGCLGFEFVFNKKVHSSHEDDASGCLIDDISNGKLPAQEPDEIGCLTMKPWRLIRACWNPDPTKRPSALQLMEELNLRCVQLPHDVLFIIFSMTANMPPLFDYLSHLDVDHWELLQEAVSDESRLALHTLATLSQVSKVWHGTAVPLLYQRMRIRAEHHISNAAATLEYRHHNPCPWIGSPYGEFVKTLEIGNRRESFLDLNNTALIASLQTLVIYMPNLRSYHTATWISTRSNVVINSYSNRIVGSLLKNGRNLTTVDIFDGDIYLGDVNKLIGGLPVLERFTICSQLFLELQTTRKRVTSTSLKTLIIMEPNSGHLEDFCRCRDVYNVAAKWNVPNLRTVLIHDRCTVTRMLDNLAAFLLAHQSKLQQIVFMRERTRFSEHALSLFTSRFSEFPNTQSTQYLVRFWKGQSGI